jgi:hypothetical protein
VSRSHWAHHNQSIKKEPLEKCRVTALRFSDQAPHINCMAVGAHKEDRSAVTNHKSMVTALRFSDRVPHRNGMAVGAHEEDRSA